MAGQIRASSPGRTLVFRTGAAQARSGQMRRQGFQEETMRKQAILLAAALAIAPLRSKRRRPRGVVREGVPSRRTRRLRETLPHSSRRAPNQGELDQPSESAMTAWRRPPSWLGSRPTSCSDSEPPPANKANGSTRPDSKSCRSQSVRAGCARLPPPCAMRRRADAPSSRRTAPRGRDAGIGAADAAPRVGDVARPAA
jgi:hypothetical protein